MRLFKLELKLLSLACQGLKFFALTLAVVLHLGMVALEIRCEVCKLLFCALPLLYALVVVMSELISATLFLLEL